MLKETQPYGVGHPSKEIPSMPQVNHPNFPGSIGQPHGTGYPAYPVPASAMPQPAFPNGYLTQGVHATIVPQAYYPGSIPPHQPIMYAQKTALGLGISQIFIGIICIVINIISLIISTSLSIIGYGIWGGILFFTSGLLCTLSGKRLPNKCLIIATMVLSIIAACICLVVFILGMLEISSSYYGGHAYMFHVEPQAIGSVLAALSVIEAVLAIISSSNCCKAVCCGRSKMAGAPINVMVYQPAIPYPINSSHPNAPMSPESFPGFTNSPSGACFPISSNHFDFGNNNPPPYNNCGNTGVDFGGFSGADNGGFSGADCGGLSGADCGGSSGADCGGSSGADCGGSSGADCGES